MIEQLLSTKNMEFISETDQIHSSLYYSEASKVIYTVIIEKWGSLQDFIINNLSSNGGNNVLSTNGNNNIQQTGEAQRITSVQSSVSIITSSNDEFSPILSTKSHRSKYSLSGARSPSGQSPVTKSRKTPHSGKLNLILLVE